MLRGQQSHAGPCSPASVRAVPRPSHQSSEPVAGDSPVCPVEERCSSPIHIFLHVGIKMEIDVAVFATLVVVRLHHPCKVGYHKHASEGSIGLFKLVCHFLM